MRCLATRSGVRRYGKPKRSVPVLATATLFGIAGLFASPQQALAQDTLVSNTGKTSTSFAQTIGHNGSSKFSAAQAFTTGDNSAGYTLSEVKATFSTVNNNAQVSIYSANAGGLPDASLFTLNNPASLTHNAINTFSVSGTQTLSALTKYFVVFEFSGATGSYNLKTTNSNDEDSGAASGWAIGNVLRSRNQDSGTWTAQSQSRSLQIDIVGSAKSTTRTETKLVSNLGQSANAVNAYVGGSTRFVLAQGFTTGDIEGGYTLTSIQFSVHSFGASDHVADVEVTIRSVGSDNRADATLYTLSNPASITNNALNTFTADSDTTLETETSYFVVVASTNTRSDWRISNTSSDAEDSDSASSWSIANNRFDQSNGGNWVSTVSSLRIAINGYTTDPSANTAASGKPAVSGVPQAGQTLTAAIGTIADADGLTSRTFPTDYTFQWVRVDGGSETDISSATSQTYTLTGDDVGKTVRVKVSFSDDDGTAEGPLTSDAYPATGTVKTAASDCPADATWCGTMTVETSDITSGTLRSQVSGYYATDNFGSLSPSTFTHDTVNYTVAELRRILNTNLTTNAVISNSLTLFVSGGGDLPDGTKFMLDGRASSLTVGTDSHNATVGQEGWNLATLGDAPDWIAGQQVTVSLEFSKPATGKPTISGPAQVGKTLTAGIGDIADEEGLPTTTFPTGYTFQWFEVDDGTDTEITGETSSTYVPVASNVTKGIKVRVSFTDEVGNAESVTSDETYAVMPAASSNCVDNNTVWCGTLTVGQFIVEEDDYSFVRSVGLSTRDSIGSVDPNTFTLGGITYTVTQLEVDKGRGVFFSTSPQLPSDGAGLTLHLQRVSGEFDLTLAGTFGLSHLNDWWIEYGVSVTQTDPKTSVSLLRAHNRDSPLPADTDIGTEVAVRLSRSPSADPSLSALDVKNAANDNTISLSPSPFAGGMTTYSADVANNVTQVSLDGTATVTGASIVYLDRHLNEIVDADGVKDGLQIPLLVGVNRFQIEVTSEDTSTVRTYDLLLQRAPPNTTTSLVTNTAQTITASLQAGTQDGTFTQTFTTGSNAGGYHLAAVDVRIEVANFEAGETLTVHVYSVDDMDQKDALLYTMTSPSSFTDNAVNTFTAPAGATLQADTDYMVVFSANSTSGSALTLRQTSSDNEDSGAVSGFSIEDAYRSNNTLAVSGNALMIGIKGSAIPQNALATLNALELKNATDDSTVTISPEFDVDTKSYTATVGNDVSRISVLPTADATSASIAYLDSDAMAIDDADSVKSGHQVDLVTGANQIDVKVTSQNMINTETYTVTVTRASDIATVTQTAGGATWTLTGNQSPNPGGRYTYTMTLASGSKPLNEYVGFHLPNTADNQDKLGEDPDDCTSPEQFCISFSGAVDTVGGNSGVFDGISGHDTRYALISGSSPFDITLTVQITEDTPTGTTIEFGAVNNTGGPRGNAMLITVTDDSKSNVATLSGLVIENAADDSVIGLTPSTFDAATTSYTATVANDVEQITIKPTRSNNSASVEYLDQNGNVIDDDDSVEAHHQVPLLIGTNRIQVKVTAEDEVANQTYTLEVTRAAPNATATLVANTGQSLGPVSIFVGNTSDFSQSFSTGSNASGYHLASVDIRIDNEDLETGETFSAEIYTVQSGHKDTLLYTLTSPDSYSDGAVNSFIAPAGATLEASTSYMVVMNGTGDSSDDFTLAVTDSNAEDAGKASGWSIEDAYRDRNVAPGNGRAFLIGIKGSALPVSDDATLSDLQIQNAANDTPITFTPTFDPATTSYSASVASDVDQITIRPTFNHSGASAVYLNHEDVPINDANEVKPDSQAPLFYGINRVRIHVTAEDGASTKNYFLVLTRPPVNSNTTLISNTGQSASPASLNVGNQDKRYTQTFSTGTSAAGYHLSAVDVWIESEDLDGSETLQVQIYTVASNARDTYLYVLTNPSSFTDAAVNSFTAPPGATLEPSTDYMVVFEVNSDNGDDFVLGIDTSNDEDAGGAVGWSIEDAYRDNDSLASSGNSLLIGIQGSELPSNDATLSDLEIENADDTTDIALTPSTFDPATTVYAASVANTVDQITVKPTLNDTAASIEYLDHNSVAILDDDPVKTDHQVPLLIGTNRIQVRVTAENDIDTETYTLTVTRAAPNSTESLVSNTGQTNSNLVQLGNSNRRYSQSFTTGSNPSGYHLASVELFVKLEDFEAGEYFTAHVFSVDSATGVRDSLLYTLTSPSSYTEEALNTFTAPAGVILEPSTQYMIVMDATGDESDDFKLSNTVDNTEDSGSASGWSIEDAGRNNDVLINSGHAFLIRINGSALPVVDDDATLSALVVEDASDDTVVNLNETFSSNTTEYTVTVANDVDTVTIKPTLSDDDAAIVYIDTDDLEATDANDTKSGHQLSLELGANRIFIQVTAEDLSTRITYTVTVTREGSYPVRSLVKNTNRRDDGDRTVGSQNGEFAQRIKTGTHIHGYELESVGVHVKSTNLAAGEEFIVHVHEAASLNAKGNRLYTLTSPSSYTNNAVNIFTAPQNARLLSGSDYFIAFEGTADVGSDVVLNNTLQNQEDANAADGWSIANAWHKNITPNVQGRAFMISIQGKLIVPSDDASLSALDLEDASNDTAIDINPTFHTDTTSYTASVANHVDSITIEPTPSDAYATIEYRSGVNVRMKDADSGKDGFQVDLDVGSTTINVEVDSADTFNRTIYTVKVTRAAEASALFLVDNTQVGIENALDATRAITYNNSRAQRFMTGSHPDGYLMTGAYFMTNDASQPTFTAKVCTVNGVGFPTSDCIDLTAPSTIPQGTVEFTAPADAILFPDTVYTLVADTTQDLELRTTSRRFENPNSLAGWSIIEPYSLLVSGSWQHDVSTFSGRIAILGYPVLPIVDPPASVLVENFDQPVDTTGTFGVGHSGSVEYAFAQAFTTGDNTTGYSLDGVKVDIGTFQTGTVPTVEIYSANSSNQPNTLLHTLTNPSVLTEDTVTTFSAAGMPPLAANTTFFAVFSVTGSSGVYSLRKTDSDDEDLGKASGWSIGDVTLEQQDGGSWTVFDKVVRISILGGLNTNNADASLRELVLKTDENRVIPLDPSFDPTTMSYRAFSLTGTVTVEAMATRTAATVKILDEHNNELEDPSVAIDGHQVPLEVGTNSFKVEVTAEDNVTKQTYTIYMVRAADTPIQDPNTVWTAKLTAGTRTSGGSTFYGFNFDEGQGELKPPSFSGEFGKYNVPVLETDGTTLTFTYRLARFNSSLEGLDFLLEVAGHRFELSNLGVEGSVTLNDPGLNWAWGDVALVKLSIVEDSTAPQLVKASVSGNSLRVIYDEPLDETSVPPTSAFSVAIDRGSGTAPTNVSIAGSTVTLTLASTVTAGQTVTLDYTVPTGASATPMKNEVGINAEALSGQAVANDTGSSPVISIEADNSSAVLRRDPVSYTLTRSGFPGADLTVDVVIGQATGYLPTSKLTKSVTIPEGAAEAKLTFSATEFQLIPVGQPVTEGKLTATVQDSSDFDVGSNSSADVNMKIALTIGFSETDFEVRESVGSFTLDLSLKTGTDIQPPSSTITFSVSTDAGSAGIGDHALDYVIVNKHIEFSPDGFTAVASAFENVHTETFEILEDTATENTETFWIIIEKSPGLASWYQNFVDEDGNSCGAQLCSPRVTIIDNDGDNAVKLFALELVSTSDGTPIELSPVFDADTLAYTAFFTGSQLTVKPSLADDTASIDFLNASDTSVADANGTEEGHQVAIVNGQNTIKVEVTSAVDSAVTRVYTVVVTKVAGSTTTQPTLVSNIGEAIDTTNTWPVGIDTLEHYIRAQTFTTGNETGVSGYNVSEVELHISEIERSDAVSVSIYADPSAGDDIRGDLLQTLTNPTSWTVGLNKFTANDLLLEPDTRYHVIIEAPSGGYRVGSTTSTAEDVISRTGWSLDNYHQTTGDRGEKWDLVLGGVLRLNITGSASTAATGEVKITGAPQVGNQLTADTSTIMDPQGLNNVNFFYQWTRVNADNSETSIGANISSYTIQSTDLGGRIKLQVDFSDDSGDNESFTSETTAAVVKAAAPCPSDTLWCSTLSVKVNSTEVDGTSAVGYKVSEYGSLSDSTFSIGATDYVVESIRWAGRSGGGDGGGPQLHLTLDKDFAAANLPALTFYVLSDEVDYPLSTAARNKFNATLANNYRWADPPSELRNVPDGVDVTVWLEFDDDPPELTESRVEGSSLVLTYNEPLDTSSVPPTSAYSVVIDSGTPFNPTGISISGNSITLTLSSLPSTATTVTLSYTAPTGASATPIKDVAGNTAADFSNESIEVNNRPTGQPTLFGPPQVGKGLATLIGDLADDDGLPTNFPADYAFQWIRVDGGTDIEIVGAQGGDYTPSAADVAKPLKVKVTFTDGGGRQETVFTEPTNPVMPVASSNCNPNTVWCGTLTVGSGSAPPHFTGFDGGAGGFGSVSPATFRFNSVTYTLDQLVVNSSNTVVFSTSPDLPSDGSGLQLHLQRISGEFDLVLQGNQALGIDDWKLDGAVNLDPGAQASDVSLLRSETSNQPLSGRTDDGTEVAVRLSYTPNSNATGVPTVSGTANANEVLTADTSGISDNNGLTDVSFSYQWLRVDADGSSNETEIGTDANTYTLTAADVRRKVIVRVSFTDDLGYSEERTSDPYPAGNQTVTGHGVGDAPVFDDSAPVTRDLAETIGDATETAARDIGEPISATDVNNEPLTYSLGGTDAAMFEIEADSGQLRTIVGERYDFEAKPKFSLQVSVTDNFNTTSAAVTVNLVNNTEEPPLAPRAPVVNPASNSAISVTWQAPQNLGRPDIVSYDLRYRMTGESTWNDGPQHVIEMIAEIGLLEEDTGYEVQVRAVNVDGFSPFSDTGAGRTTKRGAPVVRFAKSSYEAKEGGEATAITVELNPVQSSLVVINVFSYLRDGASHFDFGIGLNHENLRSSVSSSAVLAFQAGDDERTFFVKATDDTDDDDGEHVLLQFGNLPTGVAVGSPQTAQVDLVDNDGGSPVRVGFAYSQRSARESGSGSDVKLKLDRSLGHELTIPLSTDHHGGASSADYTGWPDSVTFGSGDTEKNFHIQAVDDGDDDDGESVVLGFGTLPANVTPGFLNHGKTQRIMLIDNDDAPGSQLSVSFGASSYTATEGGSAALVTVSLNATWPADSADSLTVPLSTPKTAGGATSDDFAGVPDAVTFSPGTKEVNFAVIAVDDSIDDDGESILLQFDQNDDWPSDLVIGGGPSTATVKLVDDDALRAVTVSFEKAQYSTTEEDADGVVVKVKLSEAPGRLIKVPITRKLNGATDADYSGIPEDLTFTAGDTIMSFTVIAEDDTKDDDYESVELGFGDLPSGVTAADPAKTLIQLMDDDGDPPRDLELSFDSSNGSVTKLLEGRSFRFNVNINDNKVVNEAALVIPLKVTYTGGATSNDVEGIPSSVTFTASDRPHEGAFTLTAVDDSDVDPGEGFRIEFGELPTGVTADAGRSIATFNIEDNDGPPRISVNDQTVDEPTRNVFGGVNEGELRFYISMNREPSDKTVTIDYTTVDGTAKAGEDYEATSGTLTLRSGDKSNLVKVKVLADDHDEGNETFTLKLSNPVNGVLADGVAVGTIRNTGKMPGGWLARFGRVAADQTISAVENRMRDGRQRTSHLTLGGGASQRIRGLKQVVSRTDVADGQTDPSLNTGAAARQNEPLHAVDRRPGDAYPSSMDIGHASDARAEIGGVSLGLDRTSGDREGNRLADVGIQHGGLSSSGTVGTSSSGIDEFIRVLGVPDLHNLVNGSSFFYTPEVDTTTEPGRLGTWSIWGETASSQFRGSDQKMNVDGALSTATFGFDSEWDRWLAGVALSVSHGTGGYSRAGAGTGEIVSTLTTITPYARFERSERTDLWGMIGYGLGNLNLTPARATSGIDTPLDHSMVAFGGRTMLSTRAVGAGQFQLAVRSDARVTQTVSEYVQGLADAEGVTSRFRALLEGSGMLPLPIGGVLAPKLEAGLRNDSGDAEAGAGVEIGAGLGYRVDRLSVQINARGLLAHEDSAYEEWGFSGSMSYMPSPDGSGLNVKFGSSLGAAQSGVGALWSRETTTGLTRSGQMDSSWRYQAELGYGLHGRRSQALWEPFVGLESAHQGTRLLHTGFRLAEGERTQLRLSLRRHSGPSGETNYGLQLGGQILW